MDARWIRAVFALTNDLVKHFDHHDHKCRSKTYGATAVGTSGCGK